LLDLEHVLAEVALFEERLRDGSRAELAEDPEVAAVGGGFPSQRWDLAGLADSYLRAGTYPSERLPMLLYHLMDLKLKLYWLNEPDVTDGRALIRAGFAPAEPIRTPGLYLRRLRLDAAHILLSRSAFDSLMGAIYILETGQQLESMGKRGKVGRFFKALAETSAWSGFARYEELIQAFDERVRTAEAHKFSRLRASFIHPDRPRLPVFAVSNAILTNFWENVVLVVVGEEPLVQHTGFDPDEVIRQLREEEQLDREIAEEEGNDEPAGE
jgi:hypothetical protein